MRDSPTIWQVIDQLLLCGHGFAVGWPHGLVLAMRIYAQGMVVVGGTTGMQNTKSNDSREVQQCLASQFRVSKTDL